MIYDHSENAGFDSDLYSMIADSFDSTIDILDPVHIDSMSDDVGFVVTAAGMRVDVYPPGVDEDRPGAFTTVSEYNLDATQARIVAGLLMVAAEYMEFLTREKAAGNG